MPSLPAPALKAATGALAAELPRLVPWIESRTRIQVVAFDAACVSLEAASVPMGAAILRTWANESDVALQMEELTGEVRRLRRRVAELEAGRA